MVKMVVILMVVPIIIMIDQNNWIYPKSFENFRMSKFCSKRQF